MAEVNSVSEGSGKAGLDGGVTPTLPGSPSGPNHHHQSTTMTMSQSGQCDAISLNDHTTVSVTISSSPSPVDQKNRSGVSDVGVGDSPMNYNRMKAPALRVEELRDDGESDGQSGSSFCMSEDDGGLSPGEASDQGEDFEPPSEETKDQILKQVEFYFSDANILKDTFLLKHVRRNKQGYVSLKLITSFRKVKKLAKNYKVVAYCLRESDHLEVNEEGTKVRRKEPLPDYDETTPSRTIVAVNIPYESPSIENISQLFSKCGEIALVRILRPGKQVPPDVKKHISKHPELGNVVCAVVEFESYEAAKKAVDTMNDVDDWRKGMRVVLLSAKKEKNKERKNKKDTQKTPADNVTADKDGEGSAHDTSMEQEEQKQRKKKKVPTATLR